MSGILDFADRLLTKASTWTARQTFQLLNFNSSDVAHLLVQRSDATYTANAALSTDLPRDDTIPQNTEGVEIVSQAFTAKKTGNRIRITFVGQCSVEAAGSCQVALFVDTTASAVAATSVYDNTANSLMNVKLVHEFDVADANSHTYRIRSGPNVDSSNTQVRFNGITTGRYFGGVSAAHLIIEEFGS